MNALRCWWHDKSLGIVLTVLYLATLTAHGLVTWEEYVNNQHDAGYRVVVEDWFVLWLFEIFNGWQGDIMQTLLIVLLSAHLVFKGSAESRDSDDEIIERLDRIERKIQEV